MQHQATIFSFLTNSNNNNKIFDGVKFVQKDFAVTSPKVTFSNEGNG
jgi:hypothetical protein